MHQQPLKIQSNTSGELLSIDFHGNTAENATFNRGSADHGHAGNLHRIDSTDQLFLLLKRHVEHRGNINSLGVSKFCHSFGKIAANRDNHKFHATFFSLFPQVFR